MPDWLVPMLAALVGGGGVGGWIGSVLAARTNAKAAKSTSENSLIDQLQEELKTYREDAGRRATLQDERLTRLEQVRDGYRDYAHELRSHIFDRKEPPPPEWPVGLPR